MEVDFTRTASAQFAFASRQKIVRPEFAAG
jgi:hypothetical protein